MTGQLLHHDNGRDMLGFVWVEWPGDWAALYLWGELLWQGHPGDFEWAYHLDLGHARPMPALTANGHAPERLDT